MRILIADEDGPLVSTMELMLKADGFNVYSTDLGEEAVDLAKIYDYDAIVVGLELPDMTGLEVVRAIRLAGVKAPTMVLGSNRERVGWIESVVAHLHGGADEFMPLPFHRDELVARLHSLIRRSKGHASPTVQTGDIALSLDEKTVRVRGVRIHLTGKEYQMLEFLSLRKGSTLTKDQFLTHLYGGMDEPELKIIDVFICKLRKKLKDAGADGHIHTVWGRGYALRDEKIKIVEPTEPECSRRGDLTSTSAQMLILIAKGVTSVPTLALRMGLSNVSGFASNLVKSGRVVEGGEPRRKRTLTITPRGTAWLASRGWTAPAAAA